MESQTLLKSGKGNTDKGIIEVTSIYAMSVFKFPKSRRDDLQWCIANYWWANSDKSKMYLLAFLEKSLQAKKNEGIGFKDLISFNQALLGKQCWRIIQAPDSLMTEVLKARCFSNKDFLSYKVKNGSFFCIEEYHIGPRDNQNWFKMEGCDGRNIFIYKDN